LQYTWDEGRLPLSRLVSTAACMLQEKKHTDCVNTNIASTTSINDSMRIND
jgi:hypothetical protein